jgi:hypothetical protein
MAPARKNLFGRLVPTVVGASRDGFLNAAAPFTGKAGTQAEACGYIRERDSPSPDLNIIPAGVEHLLHAGKVSKWEEGGTPRVHLSGRERESPSPASIAAKPL